VCQQTPFDAVDKLRRVVADISAATADACQRSLQHSDDMESRSCEYDNMSTTSTSSLTKVVTSNPSADAEVSANGQFVSNTSVTLSAASIPPAPPRTRTTMREMQDSSGYVSLTSPKHLPVCPPLTAVGQHSPTAAADIEKEWKQIVYAAETVVEASNSADEFLNSSFEHLPDSVDSVSEHLIVSGGREAKSSVLPLSQPLSFANPLFVYGTPTQDGSCINSFDSSFIQKSYSLTSVDGSNGTTCPLTCRPTMLADGSGYSGLTRQKFITNVQGRKPSLSNECLTDSRGDVVRETRHSAILSSATPAGNAVVLSGGLSRSTELPVSCDTEQLRRGAAASKNVMGLDTPPDSPSYVVTGTSHGVKKVTATQNNVRMGVRSMQRRLVEPDKSKIEARHLMCLLVTYVRVLPNLCAYL